MTSSLRASTVVLFLAVVVGPAGTCSASVNRSWQSNSGDWSVASFWGGGYVPSAGDWVYVVNGGTANITRPGEVCGRLMLGGTASGTIKIDSGGLWEGSPIYAEQIGNAAPGSILQSGGTHSVANGLSLGNDGGGSGTYLMSGGSLYVAGLTSFVTIGNLAPGTFVQSGGTCTFATELHLGYSANSSGTYSLSGNATLSATEEVVGDLTAGVFSQLGGTNSVAGGLILGQNAGSSGTYNLNGGLLILPGGRDNIQQGDGNAVFSMGGGTLKTGPDFSTGVPITFAPGCNAVIDSSGTLSATLSGSGSLTKTGPGKLVLSGTNTYSGGTVVQSGTLVINNRKAIADGTPLTVGSATAFPAHLISPSDDGAFKTYLPVAAPEPGSIALLSAGTFLLFGRGRHLPLVRNALCAMQSKLKHAVTDGVRSFHCKP